jgi:outer membrane protein OmpA-like peptidoglycan-associated protein
MLLVGAALCSISACTHPQPGPDKTFSGGILGAAWGAGAGAIVGHQLNNEGPGALVGAGVGLVGGAMQGAGYDVVESQHARLETDLAAMRIQNATTTRELAGIQRHLDRATAASLDANVYQVYFDPDSTNLRAGSIANLEKVAENYKTNAHAMVINVEGHADDAGTPDYNQRLSEARARNVSAYLAARGITTDSIVVRSFGSTRPIVSNSTAVGRQMNRRVDVFLSKPERQASAGE